MSIIINNIKLAERQKFGDDLQNIFLFDNQAAAISRGYPITKQEAKALLNKFRDAWELAELGSLELCRDEITDIQIDAIFTAERKTKYVNLINQFLTNETNI